MKYISFGEKALARDTHGWKYGKLRVNKEGNEETYQNSYFSTIRAALYRIMEERVHAADPGSLREVLEEIQAFRREIRGRFEGGIDEELLRARGVETELGAERERQEGGQDEATEADNEN